MYALCADFGFALHFIEAAKPFVFATVLMSKQEREALENEARETARQFGISEDKWLRWRAGYGARRDLLMVADPEREAARINEKEKATAARSGRAARAK